MSFLKSKYYWWAVFTSFLFGFAVAGLAQPIPPMPVSTPADTNSGAPVLYDVRFGWDPSPETNMNISYRLEWKTNSVFTTNTSTLLSVPLQVPLEIRLITIGTNQVESIDGGRTLTVTRTNWVEVSVEDYWLSSSVDFKEWGSTGKKAFSIGQTNQKRKELFRVEGRAIIKAKSKFIEAE